MKRSKVKRKSVSQVAETTVRADTVYKTILSDLSHSLGSLAGKCQAIEDDMQSVNPNIHPIRPITKIRWQEDLRQVIREMIQLCRTIPVDLRKEDELLTGTLG